MEVKIAVVYICYAMGKRTGISNFIYPFSKNYFLAVCSAIELGNGVLCDPSNFGEIARYRRPRYLIKAHNGDKLPNSAHDNFRTYHPCNFGIVIP